MKILKKASLFHGIEEEEIPRLVRHLKAFEREYEKNEAILWQGDRAECIGILLSGKAHSQKTNLNGDTVIVTVLEPGSYIGVLLAAAKGRKSPVTVWTQKASQVIFIPIKNIFEMKLQPYGEKLLENLIYGIAEKALTLHDRNDCLIKGSIREKVLTYLTRQNQGEGAFQVPMNRETMADYLNVDRSALSRELSRMKRDGIIDYRKNNFRLL